MKKNLKILIIIATFLLIGAIIITIFINIINKNKKIVICIDARSWRK